MYFHTVHFHTVRIRLMLTTLLIVLPAALLAACSTDDAAFNDADVTFATDMIPHHRQATEMAALVADRTDNPDVIDLAGRIEAAQDPEIDTMSGWLRDWDQKLPGKMAGMDGSMAGMMSESQLTDLANASGPAFDTLFLTMMVEHHEGAIEMAGVEQAKGKYSGATDLAASIEKGQSAEVAEMKALLAR